MTDLLSEKENIEPAIVAKQIEEGFEVKQMEDSTVDTQKLNSESNEVTDEKNMDSVNEATSKKPDLSGFTEQRIFDDLNELKESGKIDVTKIGKKTCRTILEQQYDLNKKALKKCDAFMTAFERFCAKLLESNDAQSEEPENEPKEDEKAKNSKKKKKKKDKSKKKKSRKRKHPSDDDEDRNEEDSVKNPPKKKRKTNSGKSVVDKELKTDDNEDMAESEENESRNGTKEKKKRGKKKKSVPVKGAYTLTKLRKIMKATGNANPKFYRDLKDKAVKKQIALIKEVLTDKKVDFSDLSEKAIKRLKSEWDLKREMEELGIDTSAKNDNEEQYEDGVTLSSRRPRRNVSRVSYKQKMPKFEEENSENEDDENGDEDDGKNEEAEEVEEASDEEDIYEPPSDEDEDDDDYEM